MSAIENVRRQIAIQQRTLQILKEQQAKLGVYTPPHVIIDIEDTEAALAELKETLSTLEAAGDAASISTPAEQRRIQIYLEGNFNAISEEAKQAAIDAFAAIMHISPQSVHVYSVTPGSIVFDVGVPPEAAERLRAQLRRNSAQLRLLRVRRVNITLASGAVETWRYDDDAFHPVEPASPPKPGFFKKLLSFLRLRTLLIITVAIVGGLWLLDELSSPDTPVVVPPPTQKVRPVRATPVILPEITVWLPNGCGQEYESGLLTEIGVQSMVGGVVEIYMDDLHQPVAVMEIAPDRRALSLWEIPREPGEHLLIALHDSGARGECPFSIFQVEPEPVEMTTEYDTNRPGMDIDNGFPALIDPDDTRGMEAYVEYCRNKCLENPDCRAYTFLKTNNWCFLKFDIPAPVGDDCCVSGIKINP